MSMTKAQFQASHATITALGILFVLGIAANALVQERQDRDYAFTGAWKLRLICALARGLAPEGGLAR